MSDNEITPSFKKFHQVRQCDNLCIRNLYSRHIKHHYHSIVTNQRLLYFLFIKSLKKKIRKHVFVILTLTISEENTRFDYLICIVKMS